MVPSPLTILLTLLPLTISLPNPNATSLPGLTPSQIDAYIPPFLRPSTTTNSTNTTDPSTCTRSYWKGSWAFSITIRNKTTPETSTLGTGFYDNVNADCDGIVWPANPTPLTQVGGRVTSYHVLIEVDHGEEYGGCVEQAIKQAEAKDVVCIVVPSRCRPDASQCSV